MGIFYGPNGPVSTEKDYDVVKTVPEGYVLYHKEHPTSLVFFGGQTVKVKNGIIVNQPDSNWVLEEYEAYQNKYEQGKSEEEKLALAYLQYLQTLSEENTEESQEEDTEKAFGYELFDFLNNIKEGEQLSFGFLGIDGNGKIINPSFNRVFFILHLLALKAFKNLFGEEIQKSDKDVETIFKQAFSKPENIQALLKETKRILKEKFRFETEAPYNFFFTLAVQSLMPPPYLSKIEELFDLSEKLYNFLAKDNSILETTRYNKDFWWGFFKLLFYKGSDGTVYLNKNHLPLLIMLDGFSSSILGEESLITEKIVASKFSRLFINPDIEGSLVGALKKGNFQLFRSILYTHLSASLPEIEKYLFDKSAANYLAHATDSAKTLLGLLPFLVFADREGHLEKLFKQARSVITLQGSSSEDWFPISAVKAWLEGILPLYSEYLEKQKRKSQDFISPELLYLFSSLYEKSRSIDDKTLVLDFNSFISKNLQQNEFSYREELREKTYQVFDRLLRAWADETNYVPERNSILPLLFISPELFQYVPEELKTELLKYLRGNKNFAFDQNKNLVSSLLGQKTKNLPRELKNVFKEIFSLPANKALSYQSISLLYSAILQSIENNLDDPQLLGNTVDFARNVFVFLENLFSGTSKTLNMYYASHFALLKEFNYRFKLHEFLYDLAKNQEGIKRYYLEALADSLLSKNNLEEIPAQTHYLQNSLRSVLFDFNIHAIKIKDEEVRTFLHRFSAHLESINAGDERISVKTLIGLNFAKKIFEELINSTEDINHKTLLSETLVKLTALKNSILFFGNMRSVNSQLQVFDSPIKSFEYRFLTAKALREILEIAENYSENLARSELTIADLIPDVSGEGAFVRIEASKDSGIYFTFSMLNYTDGFFEDKVSLEEVRNYLFNTNSLGLLKDSEKFGLLDLIVKALKKTYEPIVEEKVSNISLSTMIDPKIFGSILFIRKGQTEFLNSQKYDHLDIDIEEVEDVEFNESLSSPNFLGRLAKLHPLYMKVKLKNQDIVLSISNFDTRVLIDTIYDFSNGDRTLFEKLIESYNLFYRENKSSFRVFAFVHLLSRVENKKEFLKHFVKNILKGLHKDYVVGAVNSGRGINFSSPIIGEETAVRGERAEKAPNISSVFFSYAFSELVNSALRKVMPEKYRKLLESFNDRVKYILHPAGWLYVTDTTMVVSPFATFSKTLEDRLARGLSGNDYISFRDLFETERVFGEEIAKEAVREFTRLKTGPSLAPTSIAIRKHISDTLDSEGPTKAALLGLYKSATAFMHEFGHAIYNIYERKAKAGESISEIYSRVNVPAIKSLIAELLGLFDELPEEAQEVKTQVQELEKVVEDILKEELKKTNDPLLEQYIKQASLPEKFSKILERPERLQYKDTTAIFNVFAKIMRTLKEKADPRRISAFEGRLKEKYRIMDLYSLLIPEEIPSTALETKMLLGEEEFARRYPDYNKFINEVLEKATEKEIYFSSQRRKD